MISWIQRSFQHHFRTIFSVLLAVTIISFIMTIGASPGIGRSGPKALRQRFFGHDLVNQGASSQLFGDASLSLQTQFGLSELSGVSSAQLQQFGLERIASLALADQLRIPAPTQEQLAAYIKNLRVFAGPDGQFDASRYAAFRDNLKIRSRSAGVSEGDFVRVLSDDLRIDRVRQLFVGPGYALPGEVREQLARTDTRWDVAVATADFAQFKPDIPVNEDALKRFFDDNAFRYDVPPRAVVAYVAFPAAKFGDTVTLSDAEVRDYYDANPARFPKPAAKTPEVGPRPDALAPSNPDLDFAAVRPAVEQALRAERAQRQATKAASDFTLAVFDGKLRPGTPAFDAFLASGGLTLHAVPPFSRESVPTGLGWNPSVVDQALRLGDLHAMSDPLPVADGSIVLFWRETLPTYRPELAQVRDRVIADFSEDERRKRFIQWGQVVSAQLAARLKAGDSFEAAVARVGSGEPKLAVKTFAPFIRRQPPKDIAIPVANALDRLDQGQVSDMLVDQDTGSFVYVKEKKLPDLSEANPQFALTRMQLARLDAMSTGGLSVSDMVAREMKKSGMTADGR